MTFGSLFAGIGGMDLGLERAGMKCKWQVEINPFCRQVLTKHWPEVPKYEDVRTVGSELERVDLIAGGFPCQDVSNAGNATHTGLLGLEGKRSGLWKEFYRIVSLLEPKWVLVENVGALSVRGLGSVLGDLTECGFDLEWATLSASALGAQHIRKRLFIVGRRKIKFAHECPLCECCEEELYCAEHGEHFGECPCPGPNKWLEVIQDSHGKRLEGNERSILAQPRDGRQHAYAARSNWGTTTPRVYRKTDGVSNRMDRTRSIGNAVCPPVAEWIGWRIMEAT